MENDVIEKEKLNNLSNKDNNCNNTSTAGETDQGKTQQKLILVIISAILIAIFLLFLFFKKDKHMENIIFDNEDIIKPLSEQREFRVVLLPNKIEALLISDPKASKSAASLSVGVGSFMDDKDAFGLAHFCEHMLFLGSKTYPEPGFFEDHISANSGNLNAFTESERTTYYFQVSTPAFNKSLHIFSRMFAEPLFDMNYMNKEIDAVNSEAEKNLNSDGWRKRQLLKSIGNPNHPYTKFSTGNTETLRGIPAELLNKKLKNFYEKYYKSQNMKLAVISNSTLDALQSQVTEVFSDIRRNSSSEASNLYGNLETDELPFLKTQHLGKIVYYKRISTGNILDLIFSVNSTKATNEKKPLDYLDYMFKFAGEKSLINFLKKRNLANKLDAGVYESFKTFSLYSVSLELTDDGLVQADAVIKLVFNYLNKIKKVKKEEKIYAEIQKIYDAAFKFQEKNEDYTSFLSGLSTAMFDVKAQQAYKSILYRDYQHSAFDAALIEESLNDIKAENCVVLLGSHADINESLKNQFFKSASGAYKTEKWYGTQYLVSSLDEFYLDNLSNFPVVLASRVENAPLNVDLLRSFELRNENLFITKQNSLVFGCAETSRKCEPWEFSDQEPDKAPAAIYDQPNLRAFYKIDRSFHVPKVYVFSHLLSDLLKRSVKDYANFAFFAEYLEYVLNTNLSEAVEAGNSVSLEFDEGGMTLSIQAYSDVLEKIVEIVLNDLFKLQPNEYTFAEVFESAMKNLEDYKIRKPIMKNKLFFNKLVKFNNTLYTEVLDYYHSYEEAGKANRAGIEAKSAYVDLDKDKNTNLKSSENHKNENVNILNTEQHNNSTSIKLNATAAPLQVKRIKKLRFSKKQIFEDFKKFYEELKKTLVFNVLFYGHMESNEEIFKISKNIKDFITGHSSISSRYSAEPSPNQLAVVSKNQHEKSKGHVNHSSNGNSSKENLIVKEKENKKESGEKKEKENSHLKFSGKEGVSMRKGVNKRLLEHTDFIRNSIHLHRRIDDQIIFQFVNDAENEINHGITTYYQIGARDVQRSLSFSLIDKCLGTVFYHNLRTIQQLGYIVFANSQLVDSILYYKIIVQGTKKTPLEVEKAINSVLLLAEEKLRKCEAAGFTEAKASIKEILLKKDDNLKERSLRLWKEIFYNTFEFDRYQKLLLHIDEIKFDEVFQLFRSVFFENPSRISIHQYASGFDKALLTKNNGTLMEYDLNKAKKILLTNDLVYYKNQPFIQAYKTKRFNVRNTAGAEGKLGSSAGFTHGIMKKEGKAKKKNSNSGNAK